MVSATSAALALVAALALLAPGRARNFDTPAGDNVPEMVTETDPKYQIPKGFLLGAGTGAYQSEGAWDKDGKGVSVFDYQYHKENYPTNMTGDIACNSYERYEEDIKLAAQMNLNVYRFSISWTRIFPNGNIAEKNNKGVQHYHDVIKTIKANNMKPMVTIYHFDHPQALETKFGGWLSEQMIDAYADFADFLFSEYGSEVEHWVTLNEPNMHCMMVYFGLLPPGTPDMNDSAADMYTCIHHEILAHATAYRLYEQKYKKEQGGLLGFGSVSFFTKPNSTEWDDILASDRANMFDVGLLVHPLIYGDYPAVVKHTLKLAHGDNPYLPEFTEAQKKTLLPGAIDFVALNAYFGVKVAERRKDNGEGDAPRIGMVGFRADANVSSVYEGMGADNNVFGVITAWILREASLWIRANFGQELGIFITENGMGLMDSSTDDWETRAVYHSAYLRELMRTVNEDGVNVLGYSVWSLLDDFEWSAAYTREFGLVHVDFENGTLARTLKRSHHFFKRMMADRSVPLVLASSTASAAAAIAPAVCVVLYSSALSLLRTL
ncbi:myrosinase 1-like [Frankliniella occidentalis]|uniref:Myrosinase 1-like n=1 Tax=Frankliniella occidentalis TaxID=133901 RepID=A0A6J1SW68_FRAOC|nr:myrosinase 1-like [Frankliniella occidentalis]